MSKKLSIFLPLYLFSLSLIAQVEKEGVAVLRNGDTLEGKVRYEEGRLFRGVNLKPGNGKDRWIWIPSDSLRSLRLDSAFHRSFFLSKERAGVEGYSLMALKTSGVMSLYKGRYRYKSCTCQELPNIRKGAVVRKRGEDRLYLVHKNLLLDRIKNAEDLAPAFLPYDELMEKVRAREFAFSEIQRAVARYNERSKALSDP
ncbi:MAG: hypothetical protein ABEH38_08970 [Flavobacteriales bacterium]